MLGADECARISITERIIEIFEDARARSASDQELDQVLFQIGCTRIVRRSSMMIVYGGNKRAAIF